MNEDKFTGIADIYTKYRPTYPNELLDYLYSDVGINSKSTVADIGSGTGIFTELLLLRQNSVISIEPNNDMRGIAERNLSKYAKYTSIYASAENTTLCDSSVDYVTVAQAFHWFDRQRFKRECERIIKSNGKVILVWNSRDSKSDLVMENDALNGCYCPNFKGFTGGMRGQNLDEYNDFFKSGICEHKTYQNNLIYNEEIFIGRNLSASYAPKEHDENYKPYINELKLLFSKYSNNGYLCLPNITRSYVGEV